MPSSITAEDLLSRLVALPPRARDSELERLLGIAEAGELSHPPGPELIGYHPSGLAPVMRAVIEAPLTEEDVFIDLGAGLGKVAALARIVSGARVRGIEVQASLLSMAARVDGVELINADVREAELEEGTVFFLYNPFTGNALEQVLGRLHEVARRHAIVVCALGLPLGQRDWLVPRTLEHFWLQIFDSKVDGVAARAVVPVPVDPRMVLLADET